MHNLVADSIALVNSMIPELEKINEVDSIICPPFTSLGSISGILKGTSIGLGAQNLYWEEKGAFTGEISPPMVAELADFVILGHSERRAYFHDSDDVINKKVAAALTAGLRPILCIGETLEENEAGKTGDVVSRQLTAGLSGVKIEQLKEMIIAYEPVWAIGTGKAATPEGANQIIKDHIRSELRDIGSPGLAEDIPILYGGSVKPANAKDFFAQPDIDGALVGGASLNAEDFIQITKAAV
jgi:triosephosphate isomerase